MVELGRNEPCHCGSGRKYKKCCLTKDDTEARAGKAAAAEERRQAEAAKDVPEANTDKQERAPGKERGAPFAGKKGFREQSNRSGRSGIPVAGWSRSSTGNR